MPTVIQRAMKPQPANPPTSKTRRLAAFLADAGVASRRKAEVLVRGGTVAVNGAPVLDPAHGVHPGRDKVTVDGQPVKALKSWVYCLLHKPPGYLSTSQDKSGKPTVLDLVKQTGRRLYPVGRLDFNAEGLILLTDDGALANRLMHPRYQVPRVYLARVRGRPERAELEKLERGIRDGRQTLRAVSATLRRATGANAWCEVTMTEGKYREVRRMFEAIGHPVGRLIRLSYGPLELGDLPKGMWRPLTAEEVAALRALANDETAG